MSNFLGSDKAAAVLASVRGAASDRVSFEWVRKQLSETSETLPDGSIHQICIDAGILVNRIFDDAIEVPA